MNEQHKKRITKSHRYKQTFSGEHGSYVLNDLMQQHFIVSNTYNKDPLEMAYNEGQRNVLLRILKLVKEPIEKIEQRIEQMERDQYE